MTSFSAASTDIIGSKPAAWLRLKAKIKRGAHKLPPDHLKVASSQPGSRPGGHSKSPSPQPGVYPRSPAPFPQGASSHTGAHFKSTGSHWVLDSKRFGSKQDITDRSEKLKIKMVMEKMEEISRRSLNEGRQISMGNVAAISPRQAPSAGISKRAQPVKRSDHAGGSAYEDSTHSPDGRKSPFKAEKTSRAERSGQTVLADTSIRRISWMDFAGELPEETSRVEEDAGIETQGSSLRDDKRTLWMDSSIREAKKGKGNDPFEAGFAEERPLDLTDPRLDMKHRDERMSGQNSMERLGDTEPHQTRRQSFEPLTTRESQIVSTESTLGPLTFREPPREGRRESMENEQMNLWRASRQLRQMSITYESIQLTAGESMSESDTLVKVDSQYSAPAIAAGPSSLTDIASSAWSEGSAGIRSVSDAVSNKTGHQTSTPADLVIPEEVGGAALGPDGQTSQSDQMDIRNDPEDFNTDEARRIMEGKKSKAVETNISQSKDGDSTMSLPRTQSSPRLLHETASGVSINRVVTWKMSSTRTSSAWWERVSQSIRSNSSSRSTRDSRLHDFDQLDEEHINSIKVGHGIEDDPQRDRDENDHHSKSGVGARAAARGDLNNAFCESRERPQAVSRVSSSDIRITMETDVAPRIPQSPHQTHSNLCSDGGDFQCAPPNSVISTYSSSSPGSIRSPPPDQFEQRDPFFQPGQGRREKGGEQNESHNWREQWSQSRDMQRTQRTPMEVGVPKETNSTADLSTSSWSTQDTAQPRWVLDPAPSTSTNNSTTTVPTAHSTATATESLFCSEQMRRRAAGKECDLDWDIDWDINTSDFRSDTSFTLRGVVSLDDSQRTLEYEVSDEDDDVKGWAQGDGGSKGEDGVREN